jgi:hypothetical protein
MVQFQDSILECLQHYTLSNMLSDRIYETHCAWILSCSGPRVLSCPNLTNLPNLLIIFPILLNNILKVIWIIMSFNCKYPSMCVHTSHRCYMCPFFTLCPHQWAHEHPWCGLRQFYCHCIRCQLPYGTKTITHASFNHVLLLLSMNWHCVHQRWNLHPSWCCHCRSNTNGFISSILHNLKICCLPSSSNQKKSYHNQHPTNHLFPIAIEVFGCLNKQADVFLYDYADVMWSFKGPKGLPIFILVIFLHQKISITLQRMQTSSILSQAIIIGLIIFQLPPLQNAPPTTNLLQVVLCWDKKILTSSLC